MADPGGRGGREHAGNGKESTAALMFALMGDRPVETEYWTRMVVAGYNGRESGHTGSAVAKSDLFNW